MEPNSFDLAGDIISEANGPDALIRDLRIRRSKVEEYRGFGAGVVGQSTNEIKEKGAEVAQEKRRQYREKVKRPE